MTKQYVTGSFIRLLIFPYSELTCGMNYVANESCEPLVYNSNICTAINKTSVLCQSHTMLCIYLYTCLS